MPTYKATYQVEIAQVDREGNYSFSFHESLNFKAPNEKEALNLAADKAQRMTSPNKTTILESLISIS